MKRVAIAGGIALLSSVALAQTPPAPQPPSQPPVFRGGVDLIEVDVSVLDDRGRPIRDMLGPEFTVTIDGQPRKVVTAQFVAMRPEGSSASGLRRAATAPAPDVNYSSNLTSAKGRLIVLAVDRENISFGGGREIVNAASRFLDELGPADRVAFVTVPLGPQVGFTANHQLIKKELNALVGVARRPKVDLNIGVYEAFAIDEHTDPRVEVEVIARFCARLRALEAEECELNVRTQSAAIVHEQHIRTDNAIHSLESILEALREIDGPKSLVWASEGLVIPRTGAELTFVERLAAASRTTISVLMLDRPLVDVSAAEKSPSEREDRDLEMRGLELLAGRTRGALYRVSVNANAAFQRIEEELSGYYLLGVEPAASDRDGKRHPIKVTVRRQGAQVRARQEFEFDVTPRKSETAEERVQRALRAPFAATDLPLRIATYAYQNPGGPKVRLLVSAEVEGRDVGPEDVTMGFALIDREGRAVATSVQRKTLKPARGAQGPVLEDVGALVVDPGSYTLKLAVIDASGRRGSIEHPVQAYQMTGLPFAVGDLMLADTPAQGDLRPPVEARIATGRLAAYLELYADDAAFFGTTKVKLEVAADETGAALIAGNGALVESADPKMRVVSAMVPVGALPPGQYVARAIVTRGDEKVGQLSRPFQITTASAAAGVTGGTAGIARNGASPSAGVSSGRLLASMLAPPPAFRKEDTLTPDTLAYFMDALDKGRPALKATTARVRAGNFAGAGREAFDAGDQTAAMFLRGLELYASGQLTQAATQFTGALRAAPDLAGASFYLGACYAAGGKDQEAAAAWRRMTAGGSIPPAAFAVLADALVRVGDAQQAIAVLETAAAARPEGDAARRRLATAYALGLRHADALATVAPFLSEHPNDEEALLVALHAIYAAHVAGQPLLPAADERARMEQYGRAYTAAKGRHVDLVRTWVAFVLKP
jgi:VWFA-related protein